MPPWMRKWDNDVPNTEDLQKDIIYFKNVIFQANIARQYLKSNLRIRIQTLNDWTGMSRFIALCLIVLPFFYKLKICDNHFFNFVSLPHFDNSHNISSFFFIIVFVIVNCDQCSLMLIGQDLPIGKRLNLLKAQMTVFYSNKLFIN